MVQGIEGVGRRPVLLAEQQAELTAYGAPREVVNLLTTQEAHNLTSPPTRTWLIHYTVVDVRQPRRRVPGRSGAA